MRTSPDYQSRLGACLDVPVHRDSVGGMALGSATNEHLFRPYTYRGFGVDLLTPELGEDMARAEYEAKPKPKPRKKRKRMTHAQVREKIYQPRLGDRRHPEHHLYYKSDPQPFGPEPEPVDLDALMTELDSGPELERWSKPKIVRASPGWQPMTGSDIDSLLAELEDNE